MVVLLNACSYFLTILEMMGCERNELFFYGIYLWFLSFYLDFVVVLSNVCCYSPTIWNMTDCK